MTRKKAEIMLLKNEGFIILNKSELKLFIPHRRRALKLDGVIFSPSNKKAIIGFKKICQNDPDLDGHFDKKPVYPGVSIAECANLTAAMLILLSDLEIDGYPTVQEFHCTCKRPVFPEDEIEIKVDFIEQHEIKGKTFYNFTYIVNKKINDLRKLVAEGKITGTAT